MWRKAFQPTAPSTAPIIVLFRDIPQSGQEENHITKDLPDTHGNYRIEGYIRVSQPTHAFNPMEVKRKLRTPYVLSYSHFQTMETGTIGMTKGRK